MKQGICEFIIVVLVSIAVLISLSILIIGIAYPLNRVACEERTVSFQAHSYGLLAGCMVFRKNKWIPLDLIRQID